MTPSNKEIESLCPRENLLWYFSFLKTSLLTVCVYECVCERARMCLCVMRMCSYLWRSEVNFCVSSQEPGYLVFWDSVSLGPAAHCRLDWLAGDLQGVTCLTSSALRLWASVPMPGFTCRSAWDQSQPLKLAALSLPLSPWPHSFPAGHFWRCLCYITRLNSEIKKAP